MAVSSIDSSLASLLQLSQNPLFGSSSSQGLLALAQQLAQGAAAAQAIPATLPASLISAPANGGIDVTGGGSVVTNVGGISGVTSGTATIDVTALAASGQLTGSAATTSGATFAGGGSLTITGPGGSVSLSTTAGETVGQLIQAINSSGAGVNAALNSSGKLQLTTSGAGADQAITVSAVSGADITTTLGLTNASASGTNATAVVNGTTFTAESGNQFHLSGIGAGSLLGLTFSAASTGTTSVTVSASRSTVNVPPPVSSSPANALQSVLGTNDFTLASRQLANALLLQQFSLFALQQQSQAFGLQNLL